MFLLLHDPDVPTASQMFLPVLQDPGVPTATDVFLLHDPGVPTATDVFLLHDPGVPTAIDVFLLHDPGVPATDVFLQFLQFSYCLEIRQPRAIFLNNIITKQRFLIDFALQ